MKLRKFVVGALVAGSMFNVSGASAVPSGWDTDFVASTNASIQANKPLVLVWANTGCTHCEALETSLQATSFTTWREDAGYIFCFVLGSGGNDPKGGTKAKNFAKTAGGTSKSNLSTYPYVCLYWPKKDGTIAAKSFSTESANTVKTNATQLFADYAAVPDYIGGDLEFTGDYEHARLEAEVGFTTYVNVPLVRDGAAADFEGTNLVTATFGSTTIHDETLVWKAGETARNIRVDIPENAVAGDQISVDLMGDDKEIRGTVNIYIVGEQENATKNPYFIGEKTAASLGYGEWTMDLDVAMEKYQKEPDSHLMAIASGSLWCPDCVMTDAHVLETSAFKEWAQENKVILVDIDVPNFPNTTNSACLLTRVVGRTSDGYVSGRGTLATNELERFQSGAGYISRHMVSDDDMADVLERNRSLIGQNTLNGGWNNPNRANQNRTGIPNFFALKRDGTLAGTFETFDAIGPSEFKDAYLNRFSELIALCDGDADDLANRAWQTTKDTFAGEGESTTASLSAIDLIDTYELSGSDYPATEQKITVKGSDANTTITVEILAVINGSARTLATAKGKLSDGVSVTGIISSVGDFYVSVTGDGNGTLAADSTAVSTITEYRMTGERKAVENPFTNDWIAKNANTTLPLYADDGVTLSGTLSLSLKKNGKISAKYTNGKTNLATFSGKWDAAIAADGTAMAQLTKKGFSLSLTISADGVVEAEVSDGTSSISSGNCGIAENYSEFSGAYTIAFDPQDLDGDMIEPSGAAFMTLSMANTKSAQQRGLFRYVAYLPNGRKLTGTSNITWLDANYGIIPVLKKSSADTFAASLIIRKNASSASSNRAIIDLDDTAAMWIGSIRGKSFSRSFETYGCWYAKGDSLLTGIADETLNLKLNIDTATLADSPTYGALTSVLGDGAAIAITDESISVTKQPGFSFKLNKSTGVFSGTTRMSFTDKPKISAKFSGVLLRGWFSDCDCGEDNDPLIEMKNIAFGIGYCLFSDRIDKKSVKRSFKIDIK